MLSSFEIPLNSCSSFRTNVGWLYSVKLSRVISNTPRGPPMAKVSTGTYSVSRKCWKMVNLSQKSTEIRHFPRQTIGIYPLHSCQVLSSTDGATVKVTIGFLYLGSHTWLIYMDLSSCPRWLWPFILHQRWQHSLDHHVYEKRHSQVQTLPCRGCHGDKTNDGAGSCSWEAKRRTSSKGEIVGSGLAMFSTLTLDYNID